MSARRHRRAGRAVVSAALVFLVAQIVLHAALETVRPEWRDPEYGWRIKALRRLARDGRPLVVAFGSSRTQMGLSPKDLGAGAPAVFNFGQAGAGPIQNLLNLQRVLDSGLRPDGVLVEIMPATLAYSGNTESFYHDSLVRLDRADLRRLAPYCAAPDSFHAHWLAARAVPWYALRNLLLSHWQPTLLHWKQRIDFQWRLMDDRGWAKFPFDEIDDDFRRGQSEQSLARYRDTLKEFAIAPIAERLLNDTVALCRREGIPLAFYRMPEDGAFRGLMPEDRKLSLADYLAKLTFTHGVPIIDGSSWLPDDAFADGHHLLPSGARQFSARFGREVFHQWPSK